MTQKFMEHNDYSNWVILSEVEKADSGKYKSRAQAFRVAAEILNCREKQVSQKFYQLEREDAKADDFKDWTEEQKENLYTGQDEPIERIYSKPAKRSHYPPNYRTVKRDQEVITVKNDDNTETVYFKNIKNAVLSLVKDTPPAFKLGVVKSLMKDL